MVKIERFINGGNYQFTIKMTEKRTLTALVADDQKDVSDLLIKILEMKGVAVEYAPTNEEAMELLKEGNAYDLGFFDLNQATTGVELFKFAVSKGTESYICSGGAKQELLDEARAVAGDKYIDKPFNIQTIFDIVDRKRSNLYIQDVATILSQYAQMRKTQS